MYLNYLKTLIRALMFTDSYPVKTSSVLPPHCHRNSTAFPRIVTALPRHGHLIATELATGIINLRYKFTHHNFYNFIICLSFHLNICIRINLY